MQTKVLPRTRITKRSWCHDYSIHVLIQLGRLAEQTCMKLNRHKGKVTKFTCGPTHRGMNLSLNISACVIESHCAHNMWNRVSMPIVTPSSCLLICFLGCFWASGCEIHQNDWARHPGGCFFYWTKKIGAVHLSLSAMPAFPQNTEIWIAKFNRDPWQILVTFSQSTSICTLFIRENISLSGFNFHISIRTITF